VVGHVTDNLNIRNQS